MRGMTEPNSVLGYRRDGRPILLVAGAAPEDDPQQQKQPSEQPTTPQPPPGGSAPTPEPPGGQKTDEPKFTQADLDKIIADRLKAEQDKFDKRLAQETEKAGKNELEKAQLEKQQAETDRDEKVSEARNLLVDSIAEAEAVAAGVKPERVARFLKSVDLTTDGIVDSGRVDRDKIKTAVASALEDVPEFKATPPGPPKKSGGDMGGQPTGKPTFTKQQIRDMTNEERVQRIDELNEAFAEGRVTD